MLIGYLTLADSVNLNLLRVTDHTLLRYRNARCASQSSTKFHNKYARAYGDVLDSVILNVMLDRTRGKIAIAMKTCLCLVEES